MKDTGTTGTPLSPEMAKKKFETAYRLEALRLAVGISGSQSASTTVACAEDFFNFLMGSKSD